MKKMTKKLWGLLLVVVMVGALFAGCGTKAPETSAPTPETSAPVETQAPETEAVEEDFSGTITISTVARTGHEQGWNAVAKAYNEMHPNVDIIINLKPQDGYGEWVTNTCRNENPEADIAEFGQGDSSGATMIDLSDYMDMDSPYSDGTWGEQFSPSAANVSLITDRVENLNLFSTQVMWMYNMEIFEEVGVEPPTTWDELVTVCEKLAAAGYQPIAMDGDYNSYSGMTMSWLTGIYTDQTTRSLINLVRAQEGDFCYDPDKDGTWEFDSTDPWNDDDNKVTQNIVRVVRAISDADEFRMDTPGVKTVWSNFAKVIPQYTGGDAFFATTYEGAKNVFYQGKAAMMVNGGWGIIDYMHVMEEFKSSGAYTDADGNAVEGSIFTLGTFPMPAMEGEGIEAKVRTVEGPTIGISVLSKDQEHNDMVMDFFMYFTSAEGMGLFMNEMISNGGSVDGPTYVYGVDYPEAIASAFENIEYMGNSGKGYLNVFSQGVPMVGESAREFYNDSYEYFLGNITIDELLARKQANVDKYLPTLMQGLNISEEDIKNPANAPAGY